MKILFVVGASMLAAMFQAPAVPPVKMGLWESSVVSKMTGEGLPPQMATMGNRVSKVHSCFTPESYAKALASNQQQRDCTKTNEKWGDGSWSFDLTCRSGTASGHFEITFDDKENAHGSMHMNMNAAGHSVQSESTMKMHYLGPDCGKVSPDKPEIVQ